MRKGFRVCCRSLEPAREVDTSSYNVNLQRTVLPYLCTSGRTASATVYTSEDIPLQIVYACLSHEARDELRSRSANPPLHIQIEASTCLTLWSLSQFPVPSVGREGGLEGRNSRESNHPRVRWAKKHKLASGPRVAA